MPYEKYIYACDYVANTDASVAPGNLLQQLNNARPNQAWGAVRPIMQVGTCIICLEQGHKGHMCQSATNPHIQQAKGRVLSLFKDGLNAYDQAHPPAQ